MKKTTITLIKLTAASGKTLTNGETFGKEVYLGNNDAPENWREITDAESASIKAEKDESGEE